MSTALLEKPALADDAPPAALDVQAVRADFPILHKPVNGKPLCYLDNANTTQKPRVVIDAVTDYYTSFNANIHRASHALGEQATMAYEGAREKVARFINADRAEEIVFVRNATEGINLVAQTWGRANLKQGDEILLSAMEHHANIVPWQMTAQETGATIKVIPITDSGELVLDEYAKMLSPRTRFVGVVHMSNALGTVNPVKDMIQTARLYGATVLVDAAQSAYHRPIDVQDMDADFLVFSGHKLYGPTGIGVLYGKRDILNAAPPYQGGGDMIASVTWERTTYNDLPHKFEAGTPHIAGGYGLGIAVDYLTTLGMDNIAAYEHDLMTYGTEVLSAVPGLRMIGTAREKASVFSFVFDDMHAQDIGALLDLRGIAVRVGQHCAHPVLQRLGVSSTVRASLGCYNTRAEIDALADGLRAARKMLA